MFNDNKPIWFAYGACMFTLGAPAIFFLFEVPAKYPELVAQAEENGVHFPSSFVARVIILIVYLVIVSGMWFGVWFSFNRAARIKKEREVAEKKAARRVLSPPFLSKTDNGPVIRMKIANKGEAHFNACNIKISALTNNADKLVIPADRIIWVTGENPDCHFILYADKSYEFGIINSYKEWDDSTPRIHKTKFRAAGCRAHSDIRPFRNGEYTATIKADWLEGFSEPMTFKFTVRGEELTLSNE